MHIVMFSFRPHYGGAARSDVEFARRLSAHADVSVVDPYGECEPYVKAVREAGLPYHVLCPEARATVVGGKGFSRVHRLWRMALAVPNLLKVRARLCTVLRNLRPSVVCTNNFKSAILATPIWGLRGIPLVLHLRGWYTPDMVPEYGKWICRRHCAAVIAVSYATRSALQCSGIDRGIMHVLHNPIDTEEMIALSARELDAPLPQSHRPVRILVPAGIMRTKGQHTAIAALRRILDTGHDAVLWLAGDFQPIGKNKHYLQQTKALADSLGVADRVEWLGLRHDMPQVMKAATIIVLPTHSEGHPRSVVESMALAKPMAATPVGGVLDMILPEVTGLLFDVEDDEGLAECVGRFVNDPEAAAEMGRRAQDYIRRSFRIEDQINRALTIVNRVSREQASL
ncbi:MAG: glycosyltransferase family 4 protein [Phycisphaerae bacterium]|nr:glycosyltransferase family 4 protein [Phycisphaerae bacterium]